VRKRQPVRGALDERPREVHAVRLDERGAGLEPHRLVECVRHRPADQQPIDFRQERLDHVDLSRDLRPAEDRDERALRIRERPAEILELFLHQQSGDRWAEMPGDALGGRVRAMRGPERVVHVEVTKPRQRLCEGVVVLLLAGREACVLEQEDLSVLQRVRGSDRVVTLECWNELHLVTRQLRQPLRDRGE
jgi:hypothetical protein